MKVLWKRFHLSGNTLGFHPLTQKLEIIHMSLLLILEAKRLSIQLFLRVLTRGQTPPPLNVFLCTRNRTQKI